MPSSSALLDRFAEQLEQYRYAPTRFSLDVLGMDPHEGQVRWFRNSTSPENALVTGNRWGKSHGAAAKRIWKSVFRKGWTPEIMVRAQRNAQRYHSINISLTADQSRLVWFKAHGLLQNPKASWLVKDVKMTPFPTIEFVNGAIFEARSTAGKGHHLLGHDYDDVNWDEAAFERHFLEVRDNVLRMRLVDRAGTLDYTSTGNGRNDFGKYFLTGLPGEKKDPNLYSQTGPTFENPNVDHQRLLQNAERMSDRMRRQNIEGLIVEGGGSYFDLVDVEAAFDPDLDVRVLLWDEDEREAHAVVFHVGKPWLDMFPGNRYVHGWDLADKSDWTVGETWDTSTRPKTLVEFERFHKQGWSHVYDRIRARHHKYRNSSTWVDSTGVGDVVLEELGDIAAEGVKFTGSSKPELLTNIESLLSLREIRMPMIRALYDEVRFYEEDDAQLVTDCVMSLAVSANAPEMRHTSEIVYAQAI